MGGRGNRCGGQGAGRLYGQPLELLQEERIRGGRGDLVSGIEFDRGPAAEPAVGSDGFDGPGSARQVSQERVPGVRGHGIEHHRSGATIGGSQLQLETSEASARKSPPVGDGQLEPGGADDRLDSQGILGRRASQPADQVVKDADHGRPAVEVVGPGPAQLRGVRGHAAESVPPAGQHGVAELRAGDQIGGRAQRRFHIASDSWCGCEVDAGAQRVRPGAERGALLDEGAQQRVLRLFDDDLGQVEAIGGGVEAAATPVGQAGQERGVGLGADQHAGDGDALVGHAANQRLEGPGLDPAVGEHEHMLGAGLHVLQCVVGLFDGRQNDGAAAGTQAIQGSLQIDGVGGRLDRGRPAA